MATIDQEGRADVEAKKAEQQLDREREGDNRNNARGNEVANVGQQGQQKPEQK